MILAILVPAMVLLTARPGAAQAPQPGDVVINEIMYDPPAPQPSGNEWVELVNRSEATVDLADLSFQDSNENPVPVTATPTPLGPGEYAVLVANAAEFGASYPGVDFIEVSGFPGLNNGGDTPAILAGATAIDSVAYLSSWGGNEASLERLDPNAPSNQAANWGTSIGTDGGTPGAENSIFEPDITPPVPIAAEATDDMTVVVTFDEPLDQTTAETAGNYEIVGVGVPAIATLTEPAVVALDLAGPLEGPQTYTLEISGVEDTQGNATGEATIDFVFGSGEVPTPHDLVINEIAYDPPFDQPSDNEWFELFNRSSKTFDLADFSFQDDGEDPVSVTATPTLVGPGEYTVLVRNPGAFDTTYVGVPFVSVSGFPALNNSGDIPALLYGGEVIDGVPYENDWGGSDASLERRDPEGPSFSASNWGTTTDPTAGTPGEVNSIFGPDTEGPIPVSASADVTGREVTVTFNEPLDPESVHPGTFDIGGGIAIAGVAYEEGSADVILALAERLPDGESTITIRNLRDLTGNETPEAAVTITFTADATPPQLASATIQNATTIDVEFTEPILQTASFSVDGGPAVGEVAYDTNPAQSARLTLASPLPERELLHLVATHLEDVSRNVGDDSVPIFFGEADLPNPGDLVINEVMYDPATSSDGEYFELVNTTENHLFDLRDLSVDEEGRPLKDSPALIPPGAYVAVARSRDEVLRTFPEAPGVVEADQSFALPNGGSTIQLTSGGIVVDQLAYSPDWHREELDSATGLSLERRAPDLPSDATNWSSSLDPLGGTPGEPNTLSRQPEQPTDGAGIALGPPFNPDAGEAATISYRLGSEAALVRVRIFTGSGRQVRELESGVLSAREGSLTWDGRDDDGKRLRIGPYIVLLEAVDVEGGVTESYRGVVVLARQL